MKQVLLLDGKEYEVCGSAIKDNKFTKVEYINEKGHLTYLFDANYRLDGFPFVEDLDSKVFDKDNPVIRKLEQLYKDEDELRQDIAIECAEAPTPHETLSEQVEYKLQVSKLKGIGVALNLAKKSLGYKD